MITHLAVIIPARDESALLGECLLALERAVRTLRSRRPRISVSTVVVLDSCTDASADIVAEFPDATPLPVAFASVGPSRAAGVEFSVSGVRALPSTTWTAHTDADSTVPANWLLEQVKLADAGFDVVLGTVQPVREDLSPEQARAWDETHPDGRAIGSVHGASLGIRLSSYVAAGGFPLVAEHEDVELVDRLRASGAAIAATDAAPVTTSSRTVGRTPGGYAGYLGSLELAGLAEGA